MSRSLKGELNSIINDIEKSAKTARMISLNAGVIAVRTRTETNESYAFEAVASQIKDISENSVKRLESLRLVLGDLHDLTRTINIAGKQRMISQKVMKLYFIECLKNSTSGRAGLTRVKLQDEFMDTLMVLKKSKLCSDDIRDQIKLVEHIWKALLEAMEERNDDSSIALNDKALVEMNEVVLMFENLSN